MKAITPLKYHQVKCTCSCGNEFKINSTLKTDTLELELCSQCHPFYTGENKILDVSKRVQAFKGKFKVK